MDLSDSINKNSMEISKEWIGETIDYSQQLLSQNKLHLRSSLITFSSKVELIWNLNDDQNNDFIHDKLNNLDRPHDGSHLVQITYCNDFDQINRFFVNSLISSI